MDKNYIKVPIKDINSLLEVILPVLINLIQKNFLIFRTKTKLEKDALVLADKDYASIRNRNQLLLKRFRDGTSA